VLESGELNRCAASNPTTSVHWEPVADGALESGGNLVVVERVDEMPDPQRAVDLADFVRELERLRVWAGSPSYRTLAKRVGPQLRPPRVVSHVTVTEAFNPRRRRLDQDLVAAIVRALGADEQSATRWKEACVRVHVEAKHGGTTGVFRQLPADLTVFTGRHLEMTHVIQAAAAASQDGARTVVISAIEGLAGIGKTQLAVHAAHELVRAGHFTDLQLYVNLHGFDADREPVEPAAVLESLLRALEVPGPKIPSGIDERAAMFRDRLHGRPALIILDNAASEQQVRDLIPGAAGCLVLITSRRSLTGLDGAVPLRLDVFSTHEALELLDRVAGKERVAAEPVAAEAIVAACGRLPLAVSLVAGLLRSRPAWSLAHLARRLETGGLDAIGAGDRGVRAVFDLSYQGLGSAARQVFHLLALSPGADLSVLAMAAMAQISPQEAEALLESLMNEHLVQQERLGRYQLHDLLRAYAVERAEAEPDAAGRIAAARHRIAAWYTVAADAAAQAIMPTRYSEPLLTAETAGFTVAFSGSAEAMAWYDTECANLTAAVHAASDHASAYLTWRLPVAMSTYLHLTCRWQLWEQLHRIGLAAAKAADDPAGQAWTLSNLGIAQTELGLFDEAGDHLTRALEIRRGLGNSSGQAAVLGNIARLYAYSNQLQRGLEYALQALELARATGDRRRESSSLNSVACCLSDLGRYDEALPFLAAKLELHREDGDVRGLGLALHNIGEVYNGLSRHAEALASYQEALDLARGIGERHSEAGAMYGMAQVFEGLGEPEPARRRLEQAVTIFEELGAPETEDARAHLARYDTGSGTV
jgi:tetratricopeptide (TPR) repeat protein